MTAATATTQIKMTKTFNLIPLLLLMIVALAVAYGAHAVIRHGTAAEAVRQCMEDPRNVLQIWHNPETGRSGYICQVGSQFGVQIVKDQKEITSFIKEKMNRLDQVIQYMENRGYELVTKFHH